MDKIKVKNLYLQKDRVENNYWRKVEFSKVVYFQEGPGLRNYQFKNTGIPFLNIQCIKDDGTIDFDKIQYLDIKEVYKNYKHFLLQEGDLVVSSSGTLGRLAVIKKEYLPLLLNTSLIRMRPKVNDLLVSYLKYFIISKHYQSQIRNLATGSAQLNYGPTHLKQIYILLPPLSIQQKIVSILDIIQSAIEVQKKIIEKTKELKKSLLNEIFNSKFKNQNSKIKFKIQKWVKLGDENYFEIKLGGTPKTNRNEYWNGEINWITPNDLNKLTSQYIVETERKITLEGLRNGSNLLPSGSLILSTRAPIGYLAILDKDMAFNQGCKGIVFKNSKEIFNLYIYYYLLTQVNKLKELGSGSTFRELSTSDLKKFNVPLMSISEQKEIAGILQMIDEKIEIEKKKKELYEELFKTMLNKLMNQEIDVENLQI